MDVQKFWNDLDNFYRMKDIEGAEKFMLDCLSFARENNDKPAIISIINELCGFYRTLSRYGEGMSLFDEALSCIFDLGLEQTEEHGTTLLNYATLCSMAGQKEEALALYQQAADIFSAKEYAGDYRLATLYNNMSFLCKAMGKRDEAIGMLHKAMAILKQLSESEVEIAITHANLAELYLGEGDLFRAGECAAAAVSGFEKHHLENDIHYSAAVSAFAEVLFHEGDYEGAEEKFEEALRLIKRDIGTNNQNYKVTLKNIELCRERQVKP